MLIGIHYFSVYACLFCPQTFGSATEKDDHILEHFDQETCADCNQNLIRIGSNLYILRLHNAITCKKIELKTEPHFESCFVEQPHFPNEQQRECVDMVSSNSEAIIANEFQVKGGFEIERDSDELQNRPESVKKLETIDKHGIAEEIGVQCDDDQVMNDDFALDSDYSEELNFGTESLAQNKQQASAQRLDESRENQYQVVISEFNESKQVKSVEFLPIQSKECKVVLDQIPGVHFCKHCTRIFATTIELTEHQSECFVKTEEGQSNSENQMQKKKGQYSCDKCDKSYGYAGSLYKHTKLKHSSPGTHVCSICTRTFFTEVKFKKHRVACQMRRKYRIKNSIDANATFECYLCKTIQKSISALLAHMRWTHEPNGIKYRCHMCKMAFFSEQLLEMHRRRHNQPSNDRRVMCSICGIYLKKFNSLKCHMLIHSGEKPFKCTYEGCDKGFRSKSSRAEHMRRHTKEKPFHCMFDGCEQRFSYNTDLRRHKFKMHGISTKKLPCSLCDEVFPETHLLKMHMRKHKNNS